MRSLLEDLLERLQGEGISSISRGVGANEDQVKNVVSGGLPALISGLARNSSGAAGASALSKALDRDHDGSVLDDLVGFLGQGESADGESILRHILGDRAGQIEQALGQGSALETSSVKKILSLVAPLLMGVVGRAKRQQHLDSEGLAGLLGSEREAARGSAPEMMDLVSRLLDSDQDGSFADDLADAGKGILDNLFGRR